MSRKPEQYKQHVSQVIAAEQLIREGAKVHAGNIVKFLFTRAEDKRHETRVKAAELLEQGTNPDTKRYLTMLYESAANLLSFEGYTRELVFSAVAGRKQGTLYKYWNP